MSWVDEILSVDKESRVVELKSRKDGSSMRFQHYRCIFGVVDMLDIFFAQGFFKDPIVKSSRDGYKRYYDKIIEHFDCTPSHLKKVFNAAMRDLWVKPVELYAQRYAFGKLGYKSDKARFGETAYKVGIDSMLLSRVWKTKEILEETEKDGLKNIQPIVFALGKTPQELRKILGKGLWKKFCKQSYTRNRAIARVFQYGIYHGDDDIRKQFLLYNSFPSKYLRRGGNCPLPMNVAGVTYCNLEEKGLVPRIVDGCISSLTEEDRELRRQVSRNLSIISDTIRMGERLGEKFNPDWSLRKIEEKHKEYTFQIDRKKYSDERFEWLDQQSWVLDNFVVRFSDGNEFGYRLLDNALAIRNEGREQKHCVGMYSSSCADMRYMVYEVYRNSEKYATVGLNLIRDKNFGIIVTVQQQYQFANESVDTLAEEAVKYLENALNDGEGQTEVYIQVEQGEVA